MQAGGFDFYTERDARQAETEQRKIDYLEERIDYTRPESILHVYDKAIEEQLFKTPVGLMYLKKLQDFLLKQQIDPDRVRAIPLLDAYVVERRTNSDSARARTQAAKKKEMAAYRFRISVVLNVLLVLAICAMFLIALKDDQPNVYNYERVLQDRYASWEQELSAREQAIRDRERELDIDGLDHVQDK